jgi:hypothetical protein
MSDKPDEETDDPHYADRRNFYKVEKWSRDGLRVELVLYRRRRCGCGRTKGASFLRSMCRGGPLRTR